jgi:hypothetical protein
MKKAVYFAVFIFLAEFSVSSCSKESDITDPALEAVENNMEAGTWRITFFEDSGDDETSHFSGYDFTFGEDGTLTADNGMNSVQGSWSISDSNSNDDSPDDLDFNIFFNVSNDFEELNEDWDIVSNTNSKIELMHVSGGNGGTDYLTFEKN